MCLVGGEVLQGLPMRPKRRVFVRVWADKSGLLGSSRNPTDHHQFPHKDKPWSLYRVSPHLDYWVGCFFFSTLFLYYTVKLLEVVKLICINFVVWLFSLWCSDIFNLVGCLLEPATVFIHPILLFEKYIFFLQSFPKNFRKRSIDFRRIRIVSDFRTSQFYFIF